MGASDRLNLQEPESEHGKGGRKTGIFQRESTR